jgi:hypothetical protein
MNVGQSRSIEHGSREVEMLQRRETMCSEKQLDASNKVIRLYCSMITSRKYTSLEPLNLKIFQVNEQLCHLYPCASVPPRRQPLEFPPRDSPLLASNAKPRLLDARCSLHWFRTICYREAGLYQRSICPALPPGHSE